jgi:hypothetical protein
MGRQHHNAARNFRGALTEGEIQRVAEVVRQ